MFLEIFLLLLRCIISYFYCFANKKNYCTYFLIYLCTRLLTASFIVCDFCAVLCCAIFLILFVTTVNGRASCKWPHSTHFLPFMYVQGQSHSTECHPTYSIFLYSLMQFNPAKRGELKRRATVRIIIVRMVLPFCQWVVVLFHFHIAQKKVECLREKIRTGMLI